MWNKLYYSLIATGFMLLLCYVCTTQVKVGCEGSPLKEVGMVIGKPCTSTQQSTMKAQTHYKLVNVLQGVKYLIAATIPLSLIAIGTVLMIRALWKAKWQ